MREPVFFTECPRDALQGLQHFVPTDLKIKFIQCLMRCGFDALDFTSFVSPAAVPQMADAEAVCEALEKDLPEARPKLIAIVGNTQGAERAARFPWIDYLGYPHSVSSTFLKRNINSTLDESLERLTQIREIAKAHDQKVIVYLSMAFGNPYGDPWSEELVSEEAQKIRALGFEILSLSDTTAMATPEILRRVFSRVAHNNPELCCGLHLHVKPQNLRLLLEAAWQAGCRRYDGALGGFGGCPMAADTLTGNLNTEAFWAFVEEKTGYNLLRRHTETYHKCMELAKSIFLGASEPENT